MHPNIAWRLHEQRLEQRLRTRPAIDRMAPVLHAGRIDTARTMRRAVGRTIVRIGRAIEAEPRQPVASR